MRRAELPSGPGRDAHERIAALEDPGIHDAARGLARRGLDRVPEIGVLGVPVRVLRQVRAHARTELVGAEVLLEHAKDSGALLVGQDVVHALGVVRRVHRVLDGARALERVGLECGGAIEAERVPHVPLGLHGVDADLRHERRERLLEPESVPPAHGHEVAEPHVRDLVRDHVRDHELLGLGRGRRIDEEQGLAEGHQTEVLHRAGGEVGQADEIELVGREGDAEVIGEEARGKDAALLCEARERALAGLVHDPHRHAVDVDRLGELELADDEGDQVGREGHRVGEPDAPAPVAGPLVGDLLGVGERGELTVDHERDREDRLQVGLVPAGERAASARRLELRDRDDLVVAGFVLERRSVEAAQLVVEHTAEADVQHRADRVAQCRRARRRPARSQGRA